MKLTPPQRKQLEIAVDAGILLLWAYIGWVLIVVVQG